MRDIRAIGGTEATGFSRVWRAEVLVGGPVVDAVAVGLLMELSHLVDL